MSPSRSLLGWGLLLAFALFAPVSLPAGGGSQSKYLICRTNDDRTIFAGENCYLRASPSIESPSLRTLHFGTPIKVLRIWHSPDGDYWLQVKLNSIQLSELPIRGWVNV
tara:strand:+ start:1257 stop:1583 length:327 start_codon:yes stop_codon:yes gene_type:complete